MLERKTIDELGRSEEVGGVFEAHEFSNPLPSCAVSDQSLGQAIAHRTTRNTTLAPRSSLTLGQLVANAIGNDLACVETLLSKSVSSQFPAVQELAGRAAAMGGKRLRPALVLLFSRAASPATRSFPRRVQEDLERTAVAVELVHAASLVHDDVMDAATERRHQPTICHVSGNSQAVLLGDFLFTRAYAVAAQCSQAIVARRLADAATQLCEGELRQQASAGNWMLSFRDYRSILRQKTGVLIATSCGLGCSIVHQDRSVRRAAACFGGSLGLAFQIYDDWLDYWGDGERVGKTLGTDLDQLKPTLPLMRLLRTSDSSTRKRILGLLASNPTVACRHEVHAEIRKALERSDAQVFTLAAARHCVEHAKQHLKCFPESTATECIRAIADYSIDRTH